MPVFFDLHMHTCRHSPDSVINPFSLMHRARELRLDGIIITEHDCLWTEAELAELRAAVPDVKVFGGVEVSAREGHFLCYGVTDLARLPVGIGVAELCMEVHRQGGAVIAAHPFRWNQPFHDILGNHQPELDGLEVMSNNMDVDCRQKADQLWKSRTWSGLGASDAHVEETVGICHTEFSAVIRDLRDLIEALRSGVTTPHDRVLEKGISPTAS